MINSNVIFSPTSKRLIIFFILFISLFITLPQNSFAASQAPTVNVKKIEKQLKDSYKGNKDHVKFKFTSSTKTASFSLTSDSFWDEQSAVNGAVNTLVTFGKGAFKIKGVENVSVSYRSTFTDPYGKNSTDDIARIVMTKTEFKKYNWENLKYKSVYPQIKKSASVFYIHPGALRNIDLSKIKLTSI